MKTHTNIYEMTIEQIEDIKRGDVITQGNFSSTVVNIDYDWDFKFGAYIKFFTKKGEKNFVLEFDKDLRPTKTHDYHKNRFDNNLFDYN